MLNKGYMSTTTQSYQIGIKCANQWIAEEIALPDCPAEFPYSVVAQTRVKVLEIQRADLMTKMPKDFIA